ncbi:MAG: hypothetical protein OXU20_30335 [Myxococcales bacterium]|nr:hypothetical protein [Myxococcales bacterium]MDD9968958.1 hypothetical protein [Myxococcales bacterium]
MGWLAPLAFATGTSLLVHLAAYATLSWSVTLPEPGIEFEIPEAVEIGLLDMAQPAGPPEEPEPPPTSPAGSSQSVASGNSAGDRAQLKDAGVADRRDAGHAGKSDAPFRSTKRHRAEPDPRDAGRPTADSPGLDWQPRSDKGALFALRLDLDRVRESELAREIGDIVRRLPDVRALLAGSGVDPMRDLARLLVASPDLSRAKALVAGQHTGDARLPRTAAQRLAAVQGKRAHFKTRNGMEVAPWYGADGIARVLSLLGPTRFVIARRQDLPKVMAIARVWARNKAEAGAEPSAALLALPSDAVAQLDVEALELFVNRSDFDPPTRVAATIRLHPDEHKTLVAEGTLTFRNAAHMHAGATRIAELLHEFGRHPLVQLTGLGSALTSAQVTRNDDPKHSDVGVRIALTRLQAQTVLGMLRDAAAAPPDGSHGTQGADAHDNLQNSAPPSRQPR